MSCSPRNKIHMSKMSLPEIRICIHKGHVRILLHSENIIVISNAIVICVCTKIHIKTLSHISPMMNFLLTFSEVYRHSIILVFVFHFSHMAQIGFGYCLDLWLGFTNKTSQSVVIKIISVDFLLK